MARTRGGHRALGRGVDKGSGRENSGNEDAAPQRRRPTASVRRQRVGAAVVDPPAAVVDPPAAVVDPPAAVVDPPARDLHLGAGMDDGGGLEDQHVEPDIPSTEGGGDEMEGYPGGPQDTSVLTQYADHVALRVWEGQERPELKLASHGRKVHKFGRPALEIEGLVAGTGLAPLIACSVETGDRGLLSAFVERWHPETSSFHLPVGELSITLDDVASLLHIPIEGHLLSYDMIDVGQGVHLLVDLLEVTPEDAGAEMQQCHGAYVRLSWLRDIYAVKCEEKSWIVAARAYLLHLVGCTLFANKSATHISVVFLEAFRDLEDAEGYAWGVAALVHMYANLSYACQHHGKHLAGYITLLQSWIYEHFPTVGNVTVVQHYQESQPRACRWKPAQALPMITYRRRLDRLVIEDVCWTPYVDHRPHRHFDIISLFSGHIRCGPVVVRHLPGRVLRQYGYVQDIPDMPLADVPSTDDIDEAWIQFGDHLASTTEVARHPSQTVVGYMGWFSRVSHPYMRPVEVGDPVRHPAPEPHIVEDPPHAATDDPEADPPISDEPRHALATFDRIARGLQEMIDLRMVTRGTDAYAATERLLRIARSVTEERCVYQRQRRTRQRQQ